ncbi:MAG TPA: PRC-barrel domain-containing protein [Terriglobia bacterium]|nr:PRC-barrel domain-containing protein [Terriglobia bacterium]
MASTLPADQDTLAKDETYSLISASKVQGTDVYNPGGEHIGDLEDVMIDKLSGKVAYAVVSFGGFLGMGEERRALPWSILTYDIDKEGYVAQASDEVVRSTPELGDYGDREWGARLHQHYGVSPYWI